MDEQFGVEISKVRKLLADSREDTADAWLAPVPIFASLVRIGKKRALVARVCSRPVNLPQPNGVKLNYR